MADDASSSEEGGRSWGGILLQGVAMMLVMQLLMGGMRGTTKTQSSTTDVDTVDTSEKSARPPSRVFKSLYSPGSALDMRVYLSDTRDPSSLEYAVDALTDPEGSAYPRLVWEERAITLDWSDGNYRELNTQFVPSEHVYNNGSIYAHVLFSPSNQDSSHQPIVHSVHQLNRYRPRKKYVATKNLLSGEVKEPEHLEQHVEEGDELRIESFWNSNISLHIVDDFTEYPGTIPEVVAPYFRITRDDLYYPLVYWNEFWVLSEHWQPINRSVDTLPLHISYSPLSMWKFVLYIQMEQSISMQKSMGSSESELDELKRIIPDTNPWLLGLTVVVSLVHMVLDIFAFKNDVQHWRKKDSMVGISVRSIMLNTVCQSIIFLYLLDNEASFMVILSVGFGVLIEIWKLSKAFTITWDWSGRVPTPQFEFKDTYVESSTSEYDRMAFKYLSWILFPLLVAYAAYSLVYDSHKSWYSWVLGTLTGAVYAFGFIMLTPQLFINYKLKSVAHLPGRVFMYKALNTFIDDLFAFIIKMPTMHRLACLRDDIVFFVYLYQRWIYPIDKKRVNEYGMSGEDTPDQDKPDTGKDEAEDGAAEGSRVPVGVKEKVS